MTAMSSSREAWLWRWACRRVSGRGLGGGGERPWIEPSQDAELVTVAADITERAAAERIVDAALRRFGRIDTLVNNAGVLISKPFTDYTTADYAAVVGVNLTGFFWLPACRFKASRYGGHIVNIMATMAEAANSRTPAVLAALTNGAVAAATRSLATEYASYGVRVNAVSPGIIQTPVYSPDCDDLGDRLRPLGRPGQVTDVVDGVLFLESLSDITGEILHIDGGQIAGH